VTSISVSRVGASALVADSGVAGWLESGAGGVDWAETGEAGTIKKAASANERLRIGRRVMMRVYRFTRAILAASRYETVANR
jgi:hypothetical protein